MSRRVRLFSRRKRMMDHLDEDIRDFIERETHDNIERGMPPEEARYAALRKFGNVTQVSEETREVWSMVWLEQLGQDIRYGLRMLAKNPGFTAVAILTLALGIGANTAIFSVVSAVLLRPLPYQHSDRLVVVLHYGRAPVSPANFLDWQRQNHVFERMGAAEYWTPNLTGIDEPERVWALHITSDILPLLGVRPLLGRMFLPEEDEKGRDHEVILTAINTAAPKSLVRVCDVRCPGQVSGESDLIGRNTRKLGGSAVCFYGDRPVAVEFDLADPIGALW